MLFFNQLPLMKAEQPTRLKGPRENTAKESGQVVSHTSSWPHFQGTKVMLSGRFPLDLKKQIGSNGDEIFAEVRARWMMS